MASQNDDEGWTVAHVGADGFQTEISTDGHLLVADEATQEGQKTAGPDPYGYLAAALGACTCITLRMYANRKGWPLQGATARIRHSKIHARDCSECETREGRVDLLECEISLAGPLDDEQRKRLLEIADKCPVHRTLTGEISIRTRLVD